MDYSIINSKHGQERIKQLVKENQQQYIDTLFSMHLVPMRIKAIKKELMSRKLTSEDRKERNVAILKNEMSMKSAEGFKEQYESVIPFLKSLIKTSLWQ